MGTWTTSLPFFFTLFSFSIPSRKGGRKRRYFIPTPPFTFFGCTEIVLVCLHSKTVVPVVRWLSIRSITPSSCMLVPSTALLSFSSLATRQCSVACYPPSLALVFPLWCRFLTSYSTFSYPPCSTVGTLFPSAMIISSRRLHEAALKIYWISAGMLPNFLLHLFSSILHLTSSHLHEHQRKGYYFFPRFSRKDERLRWHVPRVDRNKCQTSIATTSHTVINVHINT